MSTVSQSSLSFYGTKGVVESFPKQVVFMLKLERLLEEPIAEGGERIPGYERRIVIMGQGLARTWHVQTPERS